MCSPHTIRNAGAYTEVTIEYPVEAWDKQDHCVQEPLDLFNLVGRMEDAVRYASILPRNSSACPLSPFFTLAKTIWHPRYERREYE
jgi:hypothetical protein